MQAPTKEGIAALEWEIEHTKGKGTKH